ncbi:capsule assembly Wzi family protein [Treponema denticola]|uniref:capsule assembly Wzi family protein n=1 Tax=Treponema denticola TaxID=158 RepID=UPI0020A60121|nr:capsule assembly Wzi family protein [Treponema denticola]UTC97388.1 capsule assembly Wzi family protein [Treponema denticola]
MKTIRKYRQAFLLGTIFCMLFFALTFPCGAQEAGGTLSEYQAADNSDDEEFTDDLEDDSGKPVFTVSGKLETAHGLRWNKGAEYSLSRSIAQIKGEVLAGSAYAFLSASAEYNYRNPARTGFKLNEAYFRYSGEIWDLSFGRQLINWGQADGFSLTNVLSAKDSSAFLALSSDDTKLASDSIRLRFFHDIFTFEAVAVPFFTPNKLPLFHFENGANDTLFSIKLPDKVTKNGLSLPVTYTKTENEKPKMFTDSEAAARLSFFLPGIDFSVSGFYGWDKNPRFVKSGYAKKGLFNPAAPFGPLNPYVPKELHTNLNEEYYRIGMAGIDAAIPAGDITIRLETAYIGGRYFEPKNLISSLPIAQLLDGTSNADVQLSFDPAVRKHQLLALAGLDWIKNSWTLSAQYFEDLILNHKDDIERPMHKGFVSINISKTFLRDTLKVSASGAVDINYGSTSSTYSVDYALTDNMHVILGGDIYTKGYDGKGDFAQLNKISSIWVKGRFNW